MDRFGVLPPWEFSCDLEKREPSKRMRKGGDPPWRRPRDRKDSVQPPKCLRLESSSMTSSPFSPVGSLVRFSPSTLPLLLPAMTPVRFDILSEVSLTLFRLGFGCVGATTVLLTGLDWALGGRVACLPYPNRHGGPSLPVAVDFLPLRPFQSRPSRSFHPQTWLRTP